MTLANRVREQTLTTGIGDITLQGAFAAHARFSDAFEIGDVVTYVIEDGDNYEIGSGTLTAADTLARTVVSETLVDGVYDKAAPGAIDLSGDALVFCAVTAEFLLDPTTQADVIAEVTPGAGVTLDGVLIKDGAITSAGDVNVAGTNRVTGGAAVFDAHVIQDAMAGTIPVHWQKQATSYILQAGGVGNLATFDLADITLEIAGGVGFGGTPSGTYQQTIYNDNGDMVRLEAVGELGFITIKDGNLGLWAHGDTGDTVDLITGTGSGTVVASFNALGSMVYTTLNVTGAGKFGTGNALMSAGYDDLAIGNTFGNHGITIQGARGGIAFSDGNTTSVASRQGRFDYVHATDQFEWLTSEGVRASLSATDFSLSTKLTVSGVLDLNNIASIGNVGSSSTRNALTLYADAPRQYFVTASSHYNWKLAAQDTVDDGFTIAASTGTSSTPHSDAYVDIAKFKASDLSTEFMGTITGRNLSGSIHTDNSKHAFRALDSAGLSSFSICEDGANVYLQSWNSRPLHINNLGNDVVFGSNLTLGSDEVFRDVTNSGVVIGGGTNTETGPSIRMFGNAHSSAASKLQVLQTGGSIALEFNGTDIWGFEGNITGKLVELSGDSTTPTLLLKSSNRDIAAPDGEALQIGHWNSSSSAFITRWTVGTDGSLSGARFTADRIGVGVIPNANWLSTYDTIDVSQQGTIMGYSTGGGLWTGSNWYFDGTYKHKATGAAALAIATAAGQHIFSVAASGSADSAVAWQEAFRLENDKTAKFFGNVQLGSKQLTGVTLIGRANAGVQLQITGGTDGDSGGNLVFYGESHLSNPGKTFIRSGNSIVTKFGVSLVEFETDVQVNGENLSIVTSDPGNNGLLRFFDDTTERGQVYATGTDLRVYASGELYINAVTTKFNGDLALGINTGTSRYIDLFTNGTTDGQSLGGTRAYWDNTRVAQIDFQVGNDTVNKDNGQIVFYTASAGTIMEAGRFKEDGLFRLQTGLVANGTISYVHGIHRGASTTAMTIAGGSTVNSGAVLSLYGQSHATLANDLYFQTNGTTKLHYDASSDEWNFQATNLVTQGRLSVGRTEFSNWMGAYDSIQIGSAGSLMSYRSGGNTYVMDNAYYDGTDFKRIIAGEAATHRMFEGQHYLRVAADGSAGASITWINALVIDTAGAVTTHNNLTVGGDVELGASGPQVIAGSGTPEGSSIAPVGSTYHRTDGGSGTSFYVKESGTGNTGWVAK